MMTDMDNDLNYNIFSEEITYCWVDKNGSRISPIHKNMASALSFIVDWSARKEKIEKTAADRQAEYDDAKTENPDAEWPLRNLEHKIEEVIKAKRKLTLTGEPPHCLRRLVTTTRVHDPSEAEANIASMMMSDEFKKDS